MLVGIGTVLAAVLSGSPVWMLVAACASTAAVTITGARWSAGRDRRLLPLLLAGVFETAAVLSTGLDLLSAIPD
jgi:hypothetical protein